MLEVRSKRQYYPPRVRAPIKTSRVVSIQILYFTQFYIVILYKYIVLLLKRLFMVSVNIIL